MSRPGRTARTHRTRVLITPDRASRRAENRAKEARIFQMEEALVREGERVQRLRDEHEGIERQTKALVDQEQQLMARRETELNKYVEHLNRGARQMHRDAVSYTHLTLPTILLV